jgi:hypothetical protein
LGGFPAPIRAEINGSADSSPHQFGGTGMLSLPPDLEQPEMRMLLI